MFGPESHNGYEGEWRDLAAIVRGEQKAPPTQALIDDLRFAIMLADAAAESDPVHRREAGRGMTATLNIFASESVRTTRASDAVLASLPLSYTPAADSRRRRCHRGRRSGRWPAAAVQALQDGAAGVIVVQPGPEDLGGLRALAADHHGVVVIDSDLGVQPGHGCSRRSLHAGNRPAQPSGVPDRGSRRH